MKKGFILFIFLVLAACGEKIRGNIEIHSKESIQLKDKNGLLVPLLPGEAEITMEPQGKYLSSNFFLKTKSGQWTFKIPKQAFIESHSFKVSGEALGQPIGLITDQVPIAEQAQVETRKISCARPGVCCKSGLTMAGKFETSCGLWRNCPGKQDAEFEVTKFSSQLKVNFYRNSESNIVGSFSAPPKHWESKKFIRNLTDCK